MECSNVTTVRRVPWNKGKLVGQKAPLKLKEIWAIRVRLELAHRHRELALFNFRYLGIEVDDALEMAEQTEVWLACRSGQRP
jgi:hypothetical protein